MAREKLQLTDFIHRLQLQLQSPNRIEISDWFHDHSPFLIGPSISTFSPIGVVDRGRGLGPRRR